MCNSFTRNLKVLASPTTQKVLPSPLGFDALKLTEGKASPTLAICLEPPDVRRRVRFPQHSSVTNTPNTHTLYFLEHLGRSAHFLELYASTIHVYPALLLLNRRRFLIWFHRISSLQWCSPVGGKAWVGRVCCKQARWKCGEKERTREQNDLPCLTAFACYMFTNTQNWAIT